jgi:hypothetical protein
MGWMVARLPFHSVASVSVATPALEAFYMVPVSESDSQS